ncbi:hypothetical protein BV22DRAFT_1052736 [Leucogyrophana mollusca]|uniref:Uncharacterized protein n=1 Tax=Leucogyrophana mollusca TaxID=85980 RepID=A0ACB8ATZ9_9AGAM|nr:hypothetical protein BV22DRAFT_1052736 [Leucogyrophana mollusca]
MTLCIGSRAEVKDLEVMQSVADSHVLWIIVFCRLRLIAESSGKSFCGRRYALWHQGIYHHDISERNLMYYRDKQGGVPVTHSPSPTPTHKICKVQFDQECKEHVGATFKKVLPGVWVLAIDIAHDK